MQCLLGERYVSLLALHLWPMAVAKLANRLGSTFVTRWKLMFDNCSKGATSSGGVLLKPL